MNEIMQLLQEKVGLNQEQAQAVVQILASHLQSRIPESMQGVVMPLLGVQSGGGQAADSGGLGSMLGAVEGMFGNKG
jgi:hypothetical protein